MPNVKCGNCARAIDIYEGLFGIRLGKYAYCSKIKKTLNPRHTRYCQFFIPREDEQKLQLKDLVCHSTLGVGEITDISPNGHKVAVKFNDGTTQLCKAEELSKFWVKYDQQKKELKASWR